MPRVLTFLCANFACTQLANVVQKSMYNIILSMIYHFFIFWQFWTFWTIYFVFFNRAYTLKIYILLSFRCPGGLFLLSKGTFATFWLFTPEKRYFVKSWLGTPYLTCISRQKCLSRVFLKIIFSNFYQNIVFKFFMYIFFLSIFFFVDNTFLCNMFFCEHILLKIRCSYFFTKWSCTI